MVCFTRIVHRNWVGIINNDIFRAVAVVFFPLSPIRIYALTLPSFIRTVAECRRYLFVIETFADTDDVKQKGIMLLSQNIMRPMVTLLRPVESKRQLLWTSMFYICQERLPTFAIPKMWVDRICWGLPRSVRACDIFSLLSFLCFTSTVSLTCSNVDYEPCGQLLWGTA